MFVSIKCRSSDVFRLDAFVFDLQNTITFHIIAKIIEFSRNFSIIY